MIMENTKVKTLSDLFVSDAILSISLKGDTLESPSFLKDGHININLGLVEFRDKNNNFIIFDTKCHSFSDDKKTIHVDICDKADMSFSSPKEYKDNWINKLSNANEINDLNISVFATLDDSVPSDIEIDEILLLKPDTNSPSYFDYQRVASVKQD